MRLTRLFIYSAVFGSVLMASCGDEKKTDETTETTVDTTEIPLPQMITYELVAQYPHDPTAFTEGLQFVDGHLYEGTGRYGKSELRKVELETGKVLQRQPLDAAYFGEGITVMNGKIYQLTYQEHKGFVYDQKTLKLLETFSFNTGEGWGLTNDGTHLIYSDGSSFLHYMDPKTFEEVKRVRVQDNYGPVSNINELEYIKGHIYANQWQTDLILKIDPASGKVVSQANLAGLRKQGNIPPAHLAKSEDEPEVLNGIAYDAEKNRIFVTGKNWPSLFEIKLDN